MKNLLVMKKDKNIVGKGKEQDPPVQPEKKIPGKPDRNPDPTKPKPGGNEPEKNDPTRIEEPQKTDPTRIDEPLPFNPKPEKKSSIIYLTWRDIRSLDQFSQTCMR